MCQLHYQGGGSLLCRNSTGDSWQLPFAHAPPHVRIGQSVTFSLAADRADLAVDLEVIQDKTATSSANSAVGVRNIQETAAKPEASAAKQPSRKLQRSITRFHNADLEERLQMIEAAESLLDDLLNAVELDGDAICKLLCRCAGWLHPPGSFEATGSAGREVAATEVAAVSQPGPSDLQRRVRGLLISALRSLDLRDIATYQAVETAVLYIVQLMQGKEILFCGNRKSLAVRQWQQLQKLLVADSAFHGPVKWTASNDAPEVLRVRAARKVAKDRSGFAEGVYRPNDRVRSLPAVYEAPDFVVPLKCSNCAERSRTSWFWTHPKNGRTFAVVPHNGHQTCRKSLGKKCPWHALDDTGTISDIFEHLDVCAHKKRRSRCKECGGRGLCPHNLQRSLCKECGGRSIWTHNRHRSI